MRRVAAVPGHDVHHESGGLRLAQGTRGRERHLRRVAGIDRIAGRRIALRRTADRQSVERQAPLVLAAAVNRERCGRSTCDSVVEVRDDARYEHEQGVVTANRRNRLDDLACQRHLVLHAVHVHDRDIARDCDRLRERAEEEPGVDGRGQRPPQLDVILLVGPPAGERKADRIDTRSQVFDPVLAAAIGDGGTNLLDERRTAGFHDHPGNRGVRRVRDRTCNRGLSERGSRDTCQQDDEQERFHLRSHDSYSIGRMGLRGAS